MEKAHWRPRHRQRGKEEFHEESWRLGVGPSRAGFIFSKRRMTSEEELAAEMKQSEKKKREDAIDLFDERERFWWFLLGAGFLRGDGRELFEESAGCFFHAAPNCLSVECGARSLVVGGRLEGR